jgi:NADP-dependent 3-hydroxy acid dehydrogenase YdfG
VSSGRLDGASVAVTGAARGIGRAAALGLAAEGARVAVGDLDAEGSRSVATEIGETGLGLGLDVADRASFAAFLQSAEDGNGPVEALVSNAGLLPLGPFVEMEPEVYERTIDVNLLGTVNALSLALPGMVERGHGRVVVVGSLMGRITVSGAAVYGATKFAVAALCEAVREELRGTGVDVVTIMPTLVRTDASSGVPQGRGLPGVEPEDVARAIVHACEHGGAEIAVPGWLGPVTRVGAALPATLMRPVRWALGGDRAMGDLDAGSRADYEERLRR